MKVVAIVILSALLTLFGLVWMASGVETLMFDASPTSNVVYSIRWATNSTPPFIGTNNIGTNQAVTFTNGPWGRYFFAAIATTTNGVDSDPSNIVLATNRPSAPLRMRIQPATNAIIVDASEDGGYNWRRLGVVVTNPLVVASVSNQLFRASKPPPLPPQ